MITLYMDNFRGFKDTYLPLKDVNFFVGENSTGKTSVMALLSILSTPRFWETFDFKTDFIDLGYFSEISAHSEEFTIGFYTDFENDESNNTIDFYPSLDEQIPNALFLSFARNATYPLSVPQSDFLLHILAAILCSSAPSAFA